MSFAQEKRAITIDDLWNMKRIGSFDVSPDGQKIVYDQTTYSMEGNKGATSIYIMNSDGTNPKLFKEGVSAPKFLTDGSKIFYSKSDQIYISNLNGTEEKQLTDFYSGVSGAELSIDKNSFLFSSKVYPECSTQPCNEEKDKQRKESKVKAEIFTELMYRHWNDWRGPKISHLFLFNMKDTTYSDLNLNSKFDVPPLALGSSKDFAFSPTGTEVAFSMNEDEFLATSTNNDIFILDITDLKNNSYKKISLSGGNDNHPVYSPDGNYLAYLSMERAGFEADKQRIMLYNRVTEETINLYREL